jgi:hypothetical protein
LIRLGLNHQFGLGFRFWFDPTRTKKLRSTWTITPFFWLTNTKKDET